MKHIIFLVLILVFSSTAMAQSVNNKAVEQNNVRAGDTVAVVLNDYSHFAGVLVSDTGGVVVLNVPDHGVMRFPGGAVLSMNKAPAGSFSWVDTTARRGPYSQGTRELTFLAGGGYMSNNNGGGSSSSSSSEIDFSVLASQAFYVVDGLAIEPEVGVTFIAPQSGTGNNAYSALLSLDYTFKNSGPVAGFIRAGFGLSNGVQEPIARDLLLETGQLYGNNSTDATVDILYFGIGFKTLLAKQIAIRVELAYKGQSFTIPGSTSGFISYSGGNYSLSTIGLQIGFSFLSGLQ